MAGCSEVLLSWLPEGFRQRQLWQYVHASDAHGVLRWLRAGADPNRPARLDPSLFQSHLPIQEALVRASRSGWSKETCLVLRLLLSAGGRPILYEPDGLLSPHGRALLVAGVPTWILARSGSMDITRSLEHLLGIWAAKPSRATAEDLCLLLSARARLGQGGPGGGVRCCNCCSSAPPKRSWPSAWPCSSLMPPRPSPA